MRDYLKPLANKIKTLLPENSYFDIDDGEQSFVVYPTNHINLTNDFISIEIATCIYDNITENETTIKNIAVLYKCLTNFADLVEDYASINIVGSSCVRLNWGGVYIDQDSKDFDNIGDLLNYLIIKTH